jgi:hypothetical protein
LAQLLPHPPVCVIDWAKPGKVRQVSSVEAAAEELLRGPKTKKRDKAATLLADAMAGTADMTKTKKAFEAGRDRGECVGCLSRAVAFAFEKMV